MKKAERHNKIIAIVSTGEIATQMELSEALLRQGVEATQSTLSRDIKQLRLTKRLTRGGKRVYDTSSFTEASDSAGRAAVFAEGFVGSDYSQNIVVVKTRVGMANACAVVIDALGLPEVVGTLAGDDTIIVITRSEKSSVELVGRLEATARLGGARDKV